MRYVCASSRGWPTGEEFGAELAARLLEIAPRVVVERRGVVWVDAWGVPASRLAGEVRARVETALGETPAGESPAGESPVGVGVASVPVAAECAARRALGRRAGAVETVEPGDERAYLAPLPLSWLTEDARLLELLEGVGIVHCGELAVLDREAIEVRFGAGCVELWRLARGEDGRRLFAPAPRERPHASLDFVDYVVRDPDRLLFTVNALLGGIIEALVSRGEHARRLELVLALAGGGEWRRTLRPARPTAARETWLRLARAALERGSPPDDIAGVALGVEALEPAAVRQGDLFDPGFATEAAAEAALARLIEKQGEVAVRAEPTAHPLPEMRARWVAQRRGDAEGPVVNGEAGSAAPAERGTRSRGDAEGASLTLQLLPEPRGVEVEVAERGGRAVPVGYRDGRRWRRLVTAAGPERFSGGQWEEPYAREYYRVVTEAGELIWLFRDAKRGGWYLHGWWD